MIWLLARRLFPSLFCALALTASLSLRAQDSPLTEALAAKARGHDDRAATLFCTLAEQLAQNPEATISDRIACEAAAVLALTLHTRRPTDAQLPTRVALLRTSPLGTRYKDLADQIGIALLEQAIQNGHGKTLAKELGALDSLWLCGPFENERGAAYSRKLPSEDPLDLDANYQGKLHAVAFRELAHAAPNGRFDLFNILRPNTQVACSLATTLLAAEDKFIALHIGSAGSFRVTLNGREVGARDVDRSFAFDQDVLALPLQKGRNLLQLKLCHQETGDFQVALRLRELDGSPLQNVNQNNDRAELLAAATAIDDRTPCDHLPPMQGARSLLLQNQATGYDALWLGSLFFLRAADGNVNRRDHLLALRAARDLPEVAQARMLLAATRIRMAKVSAELDENARRNDYESILAEDPQHIEALVELARMLLGNTGLVERAEQLAEQALAANADAIAAQVLRADVLQAQKQTALSRRQLMTAANAAGAPLLAILKAAAVIADDQPALAEALWQRIESQTAGAFALAGRIMQLLGRGEQEKALLLLAAIEQDQPLHRLRLLRADLAEGNGHFADAIAELGSWLTLCPDDDEALAAQSRCYGLLGDRERQIETLRMAIECNPNRRDDQRYLEFLAKDATPFYAEWQHDEAALKGTATPETSITGNDPTFTLLNQRVLRANKNGTTSDYRHFAVRILTEAGARSFANFRLPFYGDEQSAQLLSCVIRKANGKTEQPKLRGPSIALPTLQPGDVIDIEGRIDDRAPTFFGDYFGLEHRFPAYDGGASQRSELVLLAGSGRDYRYQSRNGAPEPKTRTLADGTTVYEFAMRDLPRDVAEPRQPGSKERQPLVRFTTYRDWNQFASWYWSLIKNQIEVTAPMRQKVQELTATCESVSDKIAAIYRFVTTDVRYEAWEFGVHGYKPYSTSVVYERRHGDCKDKALLLCAMLSEIQVEARPVLIFADAGRSRDDLELPLVQHFNHCIAWLPAQRGLAAQFLDGTATWHPPATLPDMDQGARVLVVGKGTAELLVVPWTTPKDNGEAVEYAIALSTDGTAKIDYHNAPRGNAAVPLRSELAAEPARLKERLERMLQPVFGDVVIGLVQASDPTSLNQQVDLRIQLSVARIGQPGADEWQLPSTLGEDPILTLDAEPTRHNPLLLGIPSEDRQVVRYQLPAGMRPSELPAKAEQTSPFGAFSVSWRLDGQQIVIERTLTIAKDRVTATEYPMFREFIAALRTADSRRVVIRRTEDRR